MTSVLNDRHPTRAMAVANWFLQRSWKDVGVPPCDQMKLYKLVYYANAWFLGNGKGELYPEDIHAWPHGPVIPSIYGEFRVFGRDPITKMGTRLEHVKDLNFEAITPTHDGRFDNFFEQVWNLYRDKTGIQLSNMTHLSDEPWSVIKNKYNGDLSTKPLIPSEVIEVCFAAKVNSG